MPACKVFFPFSSGKIVATDLEQKIAFGGKTDGAIGPVHFFFNYQAAFLAYDFSFFLIPEKIYATAFRTLGPIIRPGGG